MTYKSPHAYSADLEEDVSADLEEDEENGDCDWKKIEQD